MSIIMENKQLNWGKDIAFAISSDAVHYGDEDWGGSNYAPYGVDSSGYKLAVEHEFEIIDQCLIDEINEDKIKKFISYTIDEHDYKISLHEPHNKDPMKRYAVKLVIESLISLGIKP